MNQQQKESHHNAEIDNLEVNDAEGTELADLTVSDEEEAVVKGGAPGNISAQVSFPT